MARERDGVGDCGNVGGDLVEGSIQQKEFACLAGTEDYGQRRLPVGVGGNDAA